MFYKFLILSFALVCFDIQHVFAGSTSGVMGPVVKNNQKAIQYRLGYNQKANNIKQRLHYQQSISDNKRLRFVTQIKNNESTKLNLDYIKGELLWQISPKNYNWHSALRFDATFRNSDNPNSLGINYAGQTKIYNKIDFRAHAAAEVEVGNNREQGVSLQTRFRTSYKLNKRLKTVGLEMFNKYGSTDDFKDFNQQKHQIGPYIDFKIDDLTVYNSVLFGISDKADDVNWRLWIGKSF